MKYMLLIHQGDTPVPGTEAWGRLTEDEQREVYGAYQAINETPGVTPADVWLDAPETATTVRVQDGKTLTTDGPFVAINEGYGGRGDLAGEAIRLGRALAGLMPDEPEVQGLLALMLVNDARRDARFAEGTVVLLRDQDRSLWDLEQIVEGRATLDRALALGGRGPYVLQAAIASLHAEEPQDWPQLAVLYGELARLTGSSVVELNRAAALAEAGELEAALTLVEGLDLDRYHYLHATRAELLRRLDRLDDARAAYDRALELVHSDAERRFLEQRLAELAAD
ncbi:MAG: DUF6596 domain-containing protein [Gaiellaceae bacterium]